MCRMGQEDGESWTLGVIRLGRCAALVVGFVCLYNLELRVRR